jgi:hypothetical protein
MWNQKYEAVSSVEIIWRRGILNFLSGWKDFVFSLKGASTIMFMTMVALLLFGGKTCEQVNTDKD